MSRTLPLFLIAIMALTGFGLGAVRGTVQVDGQIVLCSGQVVTLQLDGQGHPTGQAQICPDMVMLLLATSGVAPVLAPPVRVAAQMTWMAGGRMGTPVTPPAIRARDPPITT